jgi:hypothetical protein
MYNCNVEQMFVHSKHVDKTMHPEWLERIKSNQTETFIAQLILQSTVATPDVQFSQFDRYLKLTT